MASPVVHWEISVTDHGRSVEFYSKLFGWEGKKAEGFDYTLFSPAGEGSIGGGIGPVPPGAKPMVTFYVRVDNLQAYLEKAEGMGAKTVLPPTPIPGVGSCAMFADPDGNVIGLFSS